VLFANYDIHIGGKSGNKLLQNGRIPALTQARAKAQELGITRLRAAIESLRDVLRKAGFRG
jgi:hypothetical protein